MNTAARDSTYEILGGVEDSGIRSSFTHQNTPALARAERRSRVGRRETARSGGAPREQRHEVALRATGLVTPAPTGA